MAKGVTMSDAERTAMLQRAKTLIEVCSPQQVRGALSQLAYPH
jgi:hypothetical protein